MSEPSEIQSGPRGASASPDAPSSDPGLAARYRQREAAYRAAADVEAARSRRYSTTRLLLALTAIATAIIAASSPAWREAALFALAASSTAFIVIAIAHERVERRRRGHAALADLNREAQDRLARAWTRLPEPPPVVVADDHPYASDLDLVGHASLLQLLGPPNTPFGRRELARWLLHLEEHEPEAIAARQASVRELAPRLDERQQMQAASRDARAVDMAALDPLLAWSEDESWLLARPWITVAARLLTAATTGLALASYLGWIASPLWLVTATLGWMLMFRVFGPLNAAYEAASGEYTLRPFEQLMARVAAMPATSPLLVAARAALEPSASSVAAVAAAPPGHSSTTPPGTVLPGSLPGAAASAHGATSARHGGLSAARALGSLRQFVALSDFRLMQLFYLPVQTLFLWDLHVWWGLERWRQRHGHDLRRWLEAVGRVEALSSLASLAHDQPEWTFPRVQHGQDRFAAEGIGHPLLRDDVRVTNDVTVGPAGRFLLITGSNMSGKSTLLRAVGLNTILAHAGAPVCARAMTLPPVTLYTSMRVSDSLERGLSLFMASLLRLQRVVEAARRANPAERPLLYLLDEVLQGTNSAERQVAVRTIVSHLVERGALGIVTTHDLELASAPDFTARADSRHFTEQVSIVDGELRMTFDYKLRPGPATSGNALQLLRMLGLAEPMEPMELMAPTEPEPSRPR